MRRMKYYSAIERKEVLMHATMWTNLENFTLNKGQPYSASSVGWSIVLTCQDCEFDPQSGHIQATNECINKWNNKSMFLPLLPLTSIDKYK